MDAALPDFAPAQVRMSNFTNQQETAITGRGNLLVVAGAGTGKTHTLVSRCLRVLTRENASLENILMVTFTEAAAAEMRARIRAELRRAQADCPADDPLGEHLIQQLALLDTARISTLHSFCLQLAREHFHELGLDPQFAVLDEQQTRPLQRAALDELLEDHYRREDEAALAVQALVRTVGRGTDDRIRKLVLKLHTHAQSLPNPAGWLDEQQARYQQSEPDEWRRWFVEAVADWREEFSDLVAASAGEAPAVSFCHQSLRGSPVNLQFADATKLLRAVQDADQPGNWPPGTKGKVRQPLRDFFEGAQFLGSLLPDESGNDPLTQDWEWVRQPMTALVSLTRQFTTRFTAAKRELAGVDFADLEQCALRLLREPAIASEWRERLDHLFVDEYQDINAAQDAILTTLSRSGEAANRFMVGDVKQSIYRFRLANPQIFQNYKLAWEKPGGGSTNRGQAISLTENFRSREALLNFLNPLFAALMRPVVGGVAYETLEFGAPDERAELVVLAGDAPCVELHVIARAEEPHTDEHSETETDAAAGVLDLLLVEREARLVARRLRELKTGRHRIWDKETNCLRPVKWSDMAVLLRSPSGRAEAFAMEFNKAGVPLLAARDGFFASLEVTDLLNLLRLLDNPLQDVPLAAVLRSPLVGLSLDELAQVRAHNSARPFWTALARFYEVHRVPSNTPGEEAAVADPQSKAALCTKLGGFLAQYHRWRELVRHASLSQCLESALVETHYEAILLAGARGTERMANVRRLLDLARQFDPYQRQGLYRFLRFVDAQAEEELDLPPGPAPVEDAVRLLSIHKSKGLEFPVVALACLGTRFNEQSLHEPVLLDEQLGLCPKVTPPDTDAVYPSLPYWMARRRERCELRGEELRLLYVAMTRARDALVLVGSTHRKAGSVRWKPITPAAVTTREVVMAHCPLDWLLAWLPRATAETDWGDDRIGANRLLHWWIHDEQDAVFADEAATQVSGELRRGHPVPLPIEGGIAMDVRPPGSTEYQGPDSPIDDASDAGVVGKLKNRLSWDYSFKSATNAAAKTSVSAIRRRAAEEMDEETRRIFRGRTKRPMLGTGLATGTATLSAVERGNAHHLFLQLVHLEGTGSEVELRDEAEALVRAGRMKSEQMAALNFASVAAFWQSDLGRRIRQNAGQVRRELPFTARFTPGELATITRETIVHAPDEFVVVQGVADLAVLRPGEIWLVDFKTDDVTAADVAAKAKLYEPQLKLYAQALQWIYDRPVTEGWLHFFALPKTVRLWAGEERYEQGELF